LNNWELLCDLAAKLSPSDVDTYFRALEGVENLISASWQGVDFTRRALKVDVFKRGDGTEYERLNHIYNVSRHFNPEQLPAGRMHAIWITHEGISCVDENGSEWKLSFAELREIVGMLGRMADALANNRRPEEVAAN
jgi:hypothetical protein